MTRDDLDKILTRDTYTECVEFNEMGISWCHGFKRPYFISIDHAARNGLDRGRLMTCHKCADAIMKALNHDQS